MLTSVRLGPQDHGQFVDDGDLQTAVFQSGFDYEVISGRLYVSPAPDFEHDRIEKHLLGQLLVYSLQNPSLVGYVTDRARVFVPNTDKATIPEPDLAIYRQLPSRDWRDLTPVIVGEVLRGHGVDKDLFRNVDLYLRVPTIQEYWVFDIRNTPNRPTLIVHRREGNHWDVSEFSHDAVYETPLLPGLQLAISPPC